MVDPRLLMTVLEKVYINELPSVAVLYCSHAALRKKSGRKLDKFEWKGSSQLLFRKIVNFFLGNVTHWSVEQKAQCMRLPVDVLDDELLIKASPEAT
jgi:hypothetical protein